MTIFTVFGNTYAALAPWIASFGLILILIFILVSTGKYIWGYITDKRISSAEACSWVENFWLVPKTLVKSGLLPGTLTTHGKQREESSSLHSSED